VPDATLLVWSHEVTHGRNSAVQKNMEKKLLITVGSK